MFFRFVSLGSAMALVAMLWAQTASSEGGIPNVPSPPPAVARFPPHYPSEEEIFPVWMSLLKMREGDVYRVGPPTDARLLDQVLDTVGIVAGCPILESAHVKPGSDWLDSLTAILAKPSSYRREAQMQLTAPKVVIRLRGDGDSLTVTASRDFLVQVITSSGLGMVGWLDRDSGKLAALIDAAFLPPAKRSKKGAPKTAGAHE